jgi:uncharacterized protein (DUF1330 family)
MRYIVAGGSGAAAALKNVQGVRMLADGDTLVLEGPWTLPNMALACAGDDSAVSTLAERAPAGFAAYAVEGLEQPGDGQAYVIAAHKMLDNEGFRPYAEAIPAMLEKFGVRSLARGGKVTPIAGGLVPERAVVLEFANAEAALAFYTSEVYAPLLALRLRTTDPRFIVMTRSGPIPQAVRQAADAYLRSARRG